MSGRFNKKTIIIIIGIAILGFAAFLLAMNTKPKVIKAVTVEAGTSTINVKDFLVDKSDQGSLITDIDSMLLNSPGTYEVRIKVEGKIYTSSIEVIDTVAPKAVAVEQTLLKSEMVKADAFIKKLEDLTDVKVSFKEEPDYAIAGTQEVTIHAEDTSGNQTEIRSFLTILDIVSPVSVEAGSACDVTVWDFIKTDGCEAYFLTDLTTLDISKPTSHAIQLNVNGRVIDAEINVVDTTAPAAIPIDLEIWSDETPEAISFVCNIRDITEVEVSFLVAPDFTKPGEQAVNIVLEDGYGNSNTLSAKLIVKIDEEPPVITGVYDRTVYIGEPFSYRNGVKAADNRDSEVKVNVDSSRVNLKKEGTYEVTYTAADAAGNKATKSATITVKKLIITEDILNELSDDILSEIVTEQMMKREIAWEIFQWIKKHVAYSGSSDKSDWMKEAYKGIKNGVGDCFTYYAVSEALLTRAGIDNMRVTRVGGKTQHFWNLINCGDGWYHFDTCPTKDKIDTFMMTDAEVQAYTDYRQNNYYNFDRSLYPATPET